MLLLSILNNLPHTLRTLLQLLLLALTQLQRDLLHNTLSTDNHRHRNTNFHIILIVTQGSDVALVKQNRLADGRSHAADTVGGGTLVFGNGGGFFLGVFCDGGFVNGGFGEGFFEGNTAD